MDNLDPNNSGNLDPNVTGNTNTGANAATFSWKQNLEPDIRNSPLVQKFTDDHKGLSEGFKAYSNLEKLLGHEKIPIPKGETDVEGWARFNKAMGIPATADQYGLADPENLPEGIDSNLFNKDQFAEMCFGFKLTPNQTKGMWDQHVKSVIEDYNNQINEHKTNLAKTVNELRSKWGDTYEQNIHLGQMVINRFSGGNREVEDFLTNALVTNPKGVEFLAKIGSQFAENKIGEFSATRFSLAPEQALMEIDKILADPNHPYRNESAGEMEHKAAVDYVNRLYNIANKVPV